MLKEAYLSSNVIESLVKLFNLLIILIFYLTLYYTLYFNLVVSRKA
jgi:hypothetical protein